MLLRVLMLGNQGWTHAIEGKVLTLIKCRTMKLGEDRKTWLPVLLVQIYKKMI